MADIAQELQGNELWHLLALRCMNVYYSLITSLMNFLEKTRKDHSFHDVCIIVSTASLSLEQLLKCRKEKDHFNLYLNSLSPKKYLKCALLWCCENLVFISSETAATHLVKERNKWIRDVSVCAKCWWIQQIVNQWLIIIY